MGGLMDRPFYFTFTSQICYFNRASTASHLMFLKKAAI
jgi:hypothetical protein